MNRDIILVLAAFVIYLSMMLFIGVYAAKKKSKSTEDYFLGGRSFGPFATALSAEASDMSAWMLMGLPGLAYMYGFQEAFWTGLGLMIGTYFNWLFIAKPLYNFSVKTKAVTIPDVFDSRFVDERHVLKIISALVTLFFFVVYVASAFISCSKFFSSVFGINYAVSLAISVFVIVVYTLFGGYRAVVITDFIQGLLMFVAVLITTAVTLQCIGGFAGFSSTIENIRCTGNSFITNPFADNSYSFIDKLSCLAWGIGYFGMPHILVRFMGIRNRNEIKTSRRVAMVWLLVALSAAVFMGAVGRVYFTQLGVSGFDSETIFIMLNKSLFPAFMAGVFLCGILASGMSSADSQLLVAASAFSSDLYKTRINKNASDAKVVRMSQISVFAIALVAVFLSLNENSSIFKVVAYAWAGFGSTFAPVIIFGLFWKKATLRGAVSSLVSGAVVVVVWKSMHGGIFDVYELLPGFVISSLCMVVFSLTDTAEHKKQSLEIYERYIKA